MGPRPVVGPPLELLVVLLQALSTRAKAPSNAMGASFLRFFISCSPLRDGTDNLWPHGAAMLLATLRRTGPLVTVSPRVYTKSLPRTAACNPLRGRPLGPAPLMHGALHLDAWSEPCSRRQVSLSRPRRLYRPKAMDNRKDVPLGLPTPVTSSYPGRVKIVPVWLKVRSD